MLRSAVVFVQKRSPHYNLKINTRQMNTGSVYTISLGRNSDKYLCTGSVGGVVIFRRVRLPKSKIDSLRLPETITISGEIRPAHRLEKSNTQDK